MGASPRAPLDGPPPLPPDVAQQASVEQLAGRQTPGAPGAPGAGATQQGAVVERAMLIEQGLMSLAKLMPELGVLVDDLTSRLRAGVASVLQQGSAQGSQGGASMTGGGMLTNLLASAMRPPGPG